MPKLGVWEKSLIRKTSVVEKNRRLGKIRGWEKVVVRKECGREIAVMSKLGVGKSR